MVWEGLRIGHLVLGMFCLLFVLSLEQLYFVAIDFYPEVFD
jgi:hypothetical protein